MPLSSFHPAVKAWFTDTYHLPSPPQQQGWPAIARRENVLILAPTGSGKTLAAFLKCLDQLYQENAAERSGVQVLYISPLKALNNDIALNLEAPIAGIEAKAAEMGLELPRLTKAVRTGDTPQTERNAMVKRPPHILITTPESLYLLLTSRARQMLRTVRYVIVDEIHALSDNKRGAHLSLSLERLEALTGRSPVRIGLSATQRPLEEIAHFLGGVDRPVTIIDTGTRKKLDLLIEVPLEDMRALPDNTMWAAIYPRLLERIRQHRSTLIFVNYRGLAERVAERLNALSGEGIAKVHHGSMSRAAREVVEADLKAGRLPCLVATASLELGIDIGAIDLVIQVESPKSAARGLQRIGRAGHTLGALSKGRLIPKFRGDLVEMACIMRAMRAGEVEETRVVTGALDILAQQITAMAAVDEWRLADLFDLLRRSWNYRDLTERQLTAVLEMLAGRYSSDEFRQFRPRIIWDGESGTIRARDGARSLAILSGGTIPDRGYYGVYLQQAGVKLGEVEEEFVYESNVGDVFLLGTATWRIESIEHDRINVTSALGASPRLPFWKGEGIGRPYELGQRMGRFLAEVGDRLNQPSVAAWLKAECLLDENAAANLVQYLRDQIDAVGMLPTDRQITAEYFYDELGDRRIVIHSPYGGRVHQAWLVVLRRRVHDLLGIDAELLQTDDGILIRLPGADAVPPVEQLLRVSPDEAEAILLEEIGDTPLFAAYFRMNAGRALVLPRPRPGTRQPFWLQRMRANGLLQIARKHPSFPVLLETYREVLRDVIDMDGLRSVLTGITEGQIQISVVQTQTPSPMAASVMVGFIADYMYDDGAPQAERRGALLSLNRDLLREMLGERRLQELLDPAAIAEVDQRLQRLDPEWRPRHADDVEDLLRWCGDLTEPELFERGVEPSWLAALADEGRAVPVQIHGSARWVARDDRATYTKPAAYAGPIIRRFAQVRGPFAASEAAGRYGLPLQTVLGQIALLQAEGVLTAGHFRQGQVDTEFCDTEALRQIHRRTLAKLRSEIEPVDGATLARFLGAWQGVSGIGAPSPTEGAEQRANRSNPPHTLRQVIAQLQGLALPAETWERDVLPSRVPGYQPVWLDQLTALGELWWAGQPGGKVAFYLPEAAHAYAQRFTGSQPDLTDIERGVVDCLSHSGADFLGGIARGAGLTGTETLEALLALTWAGVVTNDTFMPVRQAIRSGRSTSRRTRPPTMQGATGRWSLVSRWAANGSPSVEAYVQTLLQRYGVLCREAVAAEDGPYTWTEVLRRLQEMELRGHVRRGYFIEALSGAQFALPEAVDRLRAAREDLAGPMLLLAAADPANPYGSILPAPDDNRLLRNGATYVVLAAGRPVLAAEGHGKRLVPLEPLEGDSLRAALAAVAGLMRLPKSLRSASRLEVERWGAVPIQESDVVDALQGLGFERTPNKLVLYGPPR